MTIPKVDPDEIVRALGEFDSQLRDSPEWSDWQKNENFKWALVKDGRQYPVKQILAMATGIPTSQFSGGPESNEYLRELGFDVEPLRENGQNETARPQIFIFTAGNLDAREHLRVSIDNPVPPGLSEKHLSASDLAALRGGTNDGGNLYAWGAIRGGQNTPRWGRLRSGDYVLTVSQLRYIRLARIVGKVRDADFAQELWGVNDAGATWELMYFLTKPQPIELSLGSLADTLPSRYQGFTRIGDATLTKIEEQFGSIDAFVEKSFGAPPPAENYVLIRSNIESPWQDREGRSYHFAATVPNYTAIRRGTRVLIDRVSQTGAKIIASGIIDSARELGGDGRSRQFEATYRNYTPRRPPLHVNEELAQLIRSLPNFNAQHSIRVLTPEVFERLSAPGTAWVFAGQPSKNDFVILASLRRFTWLVDAHADRIKQGDRVYVWRYGPEAGIVFVAEVEEAPVERSALTTDARFVTDTEILANRHRRAVLRTLSVVDPPLTRQELISNGLDKLAVIAAQGGTNFRVSPEEAELIEGLLEDRVRDRERASRILVGASADKPSEFAHTQEQLRDMIRQRGRAATWWSYPLSEPAQELLRSSPYLYVYGGVPVQGLVARHHIADSRTKPGSEGLECPWPEFAREDEVGVPGVGPQLNQKFKTWFLIDRVEQFKDPIPLSRLRKDEGGQAQPNYLVSAFAIWRIAEADEPPPTKYTYEELLRDTLWTPHALDEIIEALRGGSYQIVLAGPPGTGKTWVAKAIVRYLTEDDASRWKLVQFHPSYSYEQFIQGLRPTVDPITKAIEFKPEAGIVLQMAEKIRPEGPDHFLIIDEMNRANLPRVLGELLYLFEYRDERVDLPYTPDFMLPKHFRFVGTMNTADRSIRSIDVALRRRFDVFDCPPDAGVLARYYEAPGRKTLVPDLIVGFEALNAQLTADLDPYHTIGQTFFMDPDFTSAKLSEVWRRKLRPLIEEYFFDQPDAAAKYSMEGFWPSVGSD